MKEKVYYRIELELQSPMSIGASDSVLTDVDVVLDGRGKPLIPATSLAGVYRSAFSEKDAVKIFGEVIESERMRIFGTKEPKESHPEYSESAVRVYDGTWMSGNCTVTARDNVALKDRIAIDGLKFDRQVTERGACFVTYVEVIDTNRCKLEDIEGVLGKLDSGELHLGGKTTRGMGEVSVVSCLRRCFGHEDVDAWLDFDQFDDEESASWSCSDNITDEIHKAGHNNSVELRLILKLRGGISIREYSTKPGYKDNPEPDYGQMIAHGIKDDKGEDIPVIPGTSWAGAFRERYERFAGTDAARKLFGFVDTSGSGNESNSISRISFSESKLEEGEWKQLTRNAIDRFTGGTMDGALYTERAYFCGATELVIHISPTEGLEPKDFVPLVAVLADLHNGFISVGGLASVGRGLFRITSAKLTVNGVENEGFTSAMAGENGFTDELIAPNLEKAAKLFVLKEGE